MFIKLWLVCNPMIFLHMLWKWGVKNWPWNPGIGWLMCPCTMVCPSHEQCSGDDRWDPDLNVVWRKCAQWVDSDGRCMDMPNGVGPEPCISCCRWPTVCPDCMSMYQVSDEVEDLTNANSLMHCPSHTHLENLLRTSTHPKSCWQSVVNAAVSGSPWDPFCRLGTIILFGAWGDRMSIKAKNIWVRKIFWNICSQWWVTSTENIVWIEGKHIPKLLTPTDKECSQPSFWECDHHVIEWMCKICWWQNKGFFHPTTQKPLLELRWRESNEG